MTLYSDNMIYLPTCIAFPGRVNDQIDEEILKGYLGSKHGIV